MKLSISELARRPSVITQNRRLVYVIAASVILLIDLFRRLISGELLISLLVGYLWSGLTFGVIVGLAGVGLSLTYDLLGFANFAHGDYITVSAFTGWGAAYLIAGAGQYDLGSLFFLGVGGTLYPGDIGINVANTPGAIIGGLVVAAVAGAVIAVILDRMIYRSMRESGAITLLIASVGVAFVLRYLTVYVFTQQ